MDTPAFNQKLEKGNLNFNPNSISVGDPVVIIDYLSEPLRFDNTQVCTLISRAAIHTTASMFNLNNGYLLTSTLGNNRSRRNANHHQHFLDMNFKVLKHCKKLDELITEYREAQFDKLLGIEPDD